MTIADNVKQVRDKTAEAALKAGRKADEITLVAATKRNATEKIREAILAGVDAVGENRVQEMLEKNDQSAYLDASLHFIGRLQSNKVRFVVGLCDMIQSVDSVALVNNIDKRAQALGIRQDILLEVNIGREDNKSGIMREVLPQLLEQAAVNSGVRVMGLMAIPPFNVNLGVNHQYFEEMYNLFVDIRAKKYDNISMYFLSMGMSDSFAEAIAAGANMIRVGSAIFGDRNY